MRAVGSSVRRATTASRPSFLAAADSDEFSRARCTFIEKWPHFTRPNGASRHKERPRRDRSRDVATGSRLALLSGLVANDHIPMVGDVAVFGNVDEPEASLYEQILEFSPNTAATRSRP